MRRATFVNVLKHPTLLTFGVTAHERRTNCVAAGDIRTLGVPKPGVACFQFVQQFLYLFFKLFVTVTSQDLILPSLGQLLPIRPVHGWIEMLPRYQFPHTGINLLSRLIVEAHWTLMKLETLRLRTKQKLPNSRPVFVHRI